MGGVGSSERGWCCCGRRAVEIGDGSLSDKLLPGEDEQPDEKLERPGTVVDDAWMVQVEETRVTAAGIAGRSSLFDEDEEGGEEGDEHRKTAWDLSEGDDEQFVEQAADEEEDEDGANFARTRSSKDSYASAVGRPSNNSLLFVGDVELNQDDNGGDEGDGDQESDE